MKSSKPRVVGNYILKKRIGKGSFATVWCAEHKIAGENVAIKVIHNKSIDSEEARTRFVREINIIKQTDHPFISKLFEIIETKDDTYLVMEYAENGSILNYVNTNGRLPEKHARRYFSQLISALEYLHNIKMVAHRDLKAENVLLDRNNNLRLIDFGLSNCFTEEAPELKTSCGTPAYAAPEMILGYKYTKEADIWSAGILLYAMVTGELPFDDDDIQKLLQKIVYTEPIYPHFLSSQMVDLLKKILTKNPEKRLTLEKIKRHPWFSNNEYEMFTRLQSNEEKWIQSGIDLEIVQKMQGMKININKLTQALLDGEYNETTAIYLLLRRLKVTESIKEMMNSLNDVSDKSKLLPPPDAESAKKKVRHTRPRRDTEVVRKSKVVMTQETNQPSEASPAVSKKPPLPKHIKFSIKKSVETSDSNEGKPKRSISHVFHRRRSNSLLVKEND